MRSVAAIRLQDIPLLARHWPRRARAIAILVFLGGASPGAGEVTLPRIPVPPVIDGELADRCWDEAYRECAFVLFHPRPGAAPSEVTEFLVAHDEDALYFGLRCRDAQSAAIRARLARRDTAIDDDWAGVILDPTASGRGAVELLVNPHGCQLDAYVSGEGSPDDVAADYTFTSAAARDSSGWTAELAVPLRSLHCAGADTLHMRLFALRHLARTGERASAPRIDPANPHWLADGLPLVLANVGRGRRLEVIPALVAHAHHAGRDATGDCSGSGCSRGEGEIEQGSARVSLGASLIHDLTGELAAAVAWRPDFSQVEADAPQVLVNQRFPIFYPEKRPFFLEGRELFTLAAEGGPLIAAFHSRTIMAPSLGAKLTGWLTPRDAVGLLLARDDGTAGCVRYRRALGPGAHAGLLYTERRARQERNRAGGVDAEVVPLPHLRCAFHALASADAATGRGRAWAAAVAYARAAWTLDAGYDALSPAFQSSLAFLERADVRAARAGVQLRLHPGAASWQRIVASARGTATRTYAGTPVDAQLALTLRVEGRGRTALAITRALGEERRAHTLLATEETHLYAETAPRAWLRASLEAGRAITPWYAAETPTLAERTAQSLGLTFRPRREGSLAIEAAHVRFIARATGERLATAAYLWGRLHLQPHRDLFVRVTAEWDLEQRRVVTDALVSLTTRGGIVLHVGYGSLWERVRRDAGSSAGDVVDDGTACDARNDAGENWRGIQRDLFVKLALHARL